MTCFMSSLVRLDQDTAPVLSVCHYGLLWPDIACLLGVYGLS